MAGQIKLTPDELRTSAQKYSQGSQNVQDVLTSLTNEQAVISENWNGNAFDAFEQQFNELSPKVSHTHPKSKIADVHFLRTMLFKVLQCKPLITSWS